MIQMDIKFISGRVHATPWDHHVNEGVVEWPLSPWRILRALIATWHFKAQEIPREAVAELIHTLGSVHPEYRVPNQVGSSHTRHYMPIGSIDKKRDAEKTTLVFDTFLVVDADTPLQVRWPVTLSAGLHDVLATLVARMTYLGRAESWASIELSDEAWTANCSTVPNGDCELVRLLNTYPADTYSAWRSGMMEGWKQGQPKLGKAELAKIEAKLPPTLFDALQLDTADIQKAGWSSPPGARWVDYYRPRTKAPALPKIAFSPEQPAPQLATFAFYSNVLPLFTDAFHVCTTMHKALVSRDGKNAFFSGRDEDGKPLVGHEHVFILPEHEPGKKHLNQVTLYLKDGFDKEAVSALLSLKKLYSTEDEFQEQKLILMALEGADRSRNPLVGTSRVWESYTPFVGTRHAKYRRDGTPKLDGEFVIGSPIHDLKRLLMEQGFCAPLSITEVKSTVLANETLWAKFRIHRRDRRGSRGPHPPAGFRVEFAEPQTGPMIAGFGAHLGLGVFVPVS